MNRRLLLSLLVLLVFALTSCATGAQDVPDAGQDPPVVGDEAVSGGTPSEAADREDVAVGPADVYDRYLEKYPDTNVYKMELERDHGTWVYEVKGFDDAGKYELKIDLSTGAIVKEKRELTDNVKGAALSRSHVEKIEAFVESALRDAGENAVVSEWTLENKRGTPRVEVEISRAGQKDIERADSVSRCLFPRHKRGERQRIQRAAVFVGAHVAAGDFVD